MFSMLALRSGGLPAGFIADLGFCIVLAPSILAGGRGNDIGLAENRLLMRRRRQGPGADRRRPDIGVDMDVDEAGLVELDRVFERASEIGGLGDGDAFDPASARPGGEVRIVGGLVGSLIKGGAGSGPPNRPYWMSPFPPPAKV